MGARLLVPSLDATISLYSSGFISQLLLLPQADSRYTSLRFSPDGYSDGSSLPLIFRTGAYFYSWTQLCSALFSFLYFHSRFNTFKDLHHTM